MKKIFQFFIALLFSQAMYAQETIYPAAANNSTFFITHGNVHIGNGQVMANATIQVTNSKIVKVGTDVTPTAGARVIDATGKQVYPGLISSNIDLGLKEVANGVRGTNDYGELGDINPSIRSVVAYNTDSKVINTLRSNGILLANIIPQDANPGSKPLITGTSSVVQLDAWNYEDAAYRMDGHMHFNMPSLLARSRFGGFGGFLAQQQLQTDPVKAGLEKIENVKAFFREARGYLSEATHKEINLKFEATKPLFDKKQKFLFIATL